MIKINIQHESETNPDKLQVVPNEPSKCKLNLPSFFFSVICLLNISSFN